MWFQFIFIVMTVPLANFSAQVQSTYYIEYTERVGGACKTYLFGCQVQPDAPSPKMKPPIICNLIEDNTQLVKIYSVKNFFRVTNAILPPDQSIKFNSVLGTTLPEQLFLAISYEPLDYPDFLTRKIDKVAGKLAMDGDEFRLYEFFNLTNVNVFQADPEEFVSAFLVYMKKVKIMSKACWYKLAAQRKVPPPLQKPNLVEQNTENTQKSCESTKLTDEVEELITSLFTKMIDPCFIRSLVNSNRIGEKAMRAEKLWISSAAAEKHCTTCCKSLTVFPLILRRGKVASKCRDLVKGTCLKHTCMCSSYRVTSSLVPKVTMAECNNRIVSLATKGEIQRFTTAMPSF